MSTAAKKNAPPPPKRTHLPPSRRKIHSKKSTSAHFFKIISIPAIAARERSVGESEKWWIASAAAAPPAVPMAEPAADAKNEGSRASAISTRPAFVPNFNAADLREALEVVRQLDPPGVGCRDLRECLLYQLRYHEQQLALHKNGNGEATAQLLNDAIAIVDQHLRALQLKQHKEIAKALGRPIEAVQQALDYIRTLDPRPGLRYNKAQPQLIEPDVAFVKHGDEWLVVMNEEDVPQLRLNPAYRRLLTRDGNDKDTRNYVKERYKSAIQLTRRTVAKYREDMRIPSTHQRRVKK